MKYKSSKSTLFLMEIIIAILFLAITSGICLQIFAASAQVSQETYHLNASINQLNTFAQYLKSAQGDLKEVADYWEVKQEKNEVQIFYDTQWQQTTKENGVFVLQAHWQEKQVLVTIKSLQKNQVFLTQELAFYHPLTKQEVLSDE